MLSTVDGVASADILGGQTFAMRLWLDPVKMAGRSVSPADVAAAPAEVTARLAQQVGVSPAALGRYAAQTAGRSRREHIEMVVAHAGWRTCGRGEWKALGDWLVARAIEHDTPSVLFRQALEHLRGAVPGETKHGERDRRQRQS